MVCVLSGAKMGNELIQLIVSKPKAFIKIIPGIPDGMSWKIFVELGGLGNKSLKTGENSNRLRHAANCQVQPKNPNIKKR